MTAVLRFVIGAALYALGIFLVQESAGHATLPSFFLSVIGGVVIAFTAIWQRK